MKQALLVVALLGSVALLAHGQPSEQESRELEIAASMAQGNCCKDLLAAIMDIDVMACLYWNSINLVGIEMAAIQGRITRGEAEMLVQRSSAAGEKCSKGKTLSPLGRSVAQAARAQFDLEFGSDVLRAPGEVGPNRLADGQPEQENYEAKLREVWELAAQENRDPNEREVMELGMLAMLAEGAADEVEVLTLMTRFAVEEVMAREEEIEALKDDVRILACGGSLMWWSANTYSIEGGIPEMGRRLNECLGGLDPDEKSDFASEEMDRANSFFPPIKR